MKLRVCDLSDFVGPGGDVTAYLTLPGKSRATFIADVLERARVGRPFSDVPDFIRQRMLSSRYRDLRWEDQLVYLQLVLRTSRYFFLTRVINGMRVRVKPGEYYTSLAKMVEICPFYTVKQMRTCLERQVEVGFIRQRDLRMKRGRIITLVGWHEDQGQSEWRTNRWILDLKRYPFPPSIIGRLTVSNPDNNQSEQGK